MSVWACAGWLWLGSVITAAALVVLAAAPRVQAQAPRARLEWERPAASMCPSASVLQGDVATLLGHDPFVRPGRARGPAAEDEAPDLILRGHAEERDGDAYARVEAVTTGGVSLGARELTAPHGECAALRKPLALIISLFLESQPAPAARDPHAQRAWALGGSLALRSGLLPRVTPGLGFDVRARLLSRLELTFQAAYWFPVAIETRAGLGARFQAFDASAGLCPRLTPKPGPLSVFLCGALQTGALVAAPRGLDGPARQARLSASALLELKLRYALGRRLSLEGALGGVVALVQPLFYLTRSDGSTLDVHRPDRFGVLLRVALFFELPS